MKAVPLASPLAHACLQARLIRTVQAVPGGMALPVVSLARRALGPGPGHTDELARGDMLFGRDGIAPTWAAAPQSAARAYGPGRAPLTPRPAAARFTQPRVMPG